MGLSDECEEMGKALHLARRLSLRESLRGALRRRDGEEVAALLSCFTCDTTTASDPVLLEARSFIDLAALLVRLQNAAEEGYRLLSLGACEDEDEEDDYGDEDEFEVETEDAQASLTGAAAKVTGLLTQASALGARSDELTGAQLVQRQLQSAAAELQAHQAQVRQTIATASAG